MHTRTHSLQSFEGGPKSERFEEKCKFSQIIEDTEFVI